MVLSHWKPDRYGENVNKDVIKYVMEHFRTLWWAVETSRRCQWSRKQVGPPSDGRVVVDVIKIVPSNDIISAHWWFQPELEGFRLFSSRRVHSHSTMEVGLEPGDMAGLPLHCPDVWNGVHNFSRSCP